MVQKCRLISYYEHVPLLNFIVDFHTNLQRKIIISLEKVEFSFQETPFET